MTTCSVDDCLNPRRSKNDPLCESHRKQAQRGGRIAEIRAYDRSPRQAVEDAMLTFLDVRSSDDAGWDKARANFWRAVERWAQKWSEKRAARLQKQAHGAHGQLHRKR